MGSLGVNNVNFQLSGEKMANLLDKTVKIGANPIDSINFTAYRGRTNCKSIYYLTN